MGLHRPVHTPSCHPPMGQTEPFMDPVYLGKVPRGPAGDVSSSDLTALSAPQEQTVTRTWPMSRAGFMLWPTSITMSVLMVYKNKYLMQVTQREEAEKCLLPGIGSSLSLDRSCYFHDKEATKFSLCNLCF